MHQSALQCYINCENKEEKKLMIKSTLIIKGQITLTSLEIFLNNTSNTSNFSNTPPYFIRFNKYVAIQFNFSHFGLFVFMSSHFTIKLNEVFLLHWRNKNICFYHQIESNISDYIRDQKRIYK